MAKPKLDIEDDAALDEVASVNGIRESARSPKAVARPIPSRCARTGLPMVFAALFGIRSVALAARGGPRRCGQQHRLPALDPAVRRTVELVSNARGTAPDRAVASNSTDTGAVEARSTPRLRAAEIGVAAGVDGPTRHFNPQPLASMPAAADALAHCDLPDVSAGSHTNRQVKDIATVLPPGVCCGGVVVDGNARVTLQAGIHVILDDPPQLASDSTIAAASADAGVIVRRLSMHSNAELVLDTDRATSDPLCALRPRQPILVYSRCAVPGRSGVFGEL